MRSWLPLASLCLPLALAACKDAPLSEGLSDEVAAVVAPCDALDGAGRDWCVIQGMDNSADPLPGTETVVLCDRLEDSDAKDRCIELSVRVHESPAPPTHCDDIGDELMRHSCWLSDADRQMMQPIEDVMAVCKKAESLMRHCVVHVSTHRLDYWAAEGFEVMTGDVRAILDTSEGLEGSIEFGQGIGAAARQLGLAPGMAGPCDAFRYGNGKMACEAAVLGRQVGIPQGSPMGGGGQAGPPGQ